jgi:hypothetical protein
VVHLTTLSGSQRLCTSNIYVCWSKLQRSLSMGLRQLASGIVNWNPAGGMDVCLFPVLFVVSQKSLRGADHSSKGVVPSVVCLSVIVKHRKWGGCGPLGAVAPCKIKHLVLIQRYPSTIKNIYHNVEEGQDRFICPFEYCRMFIVITCFVFERFTKEL